MKNQIFYPGASPQATCPTKGTGLLISLLLAFFPLSLLPAQISLTCPGPVTIDCAADPLPSLTGSPAATTTCGTSPEVTFTYQDNTSQLTGCMGTGLLRRTWIATDLCGSSASCIQNITIEDNTSPSLTCPSFKIISCDADTSPTALGMAIAADNCTPTDEITITYTDQTQNLFLCNGTGTFTRHWKATDMCGNVAACIQTIVIMDVIKPILTIPPPITISCHESAGTEFTGLATATDNCTSTDQIQVNFSDNVQGLTGCNGTGTIVRTWTARDACQNIAIGTQFIYVMDQTAPAITIPSNITVSCESSLLPAITGNATANDLCGPAFIGYTDVILGNLGCNGTGLIERTWTATDGCSNLSTGIQIITIVDQTKPSIGCPSNITVDCSQGVLPSVTGQPSVSDNCTPSAQLQVTYADFNLVPPGCNETRLLRRTWRVTDACGNSTTCHQFITVTDLLKPTLICPPTVTISCESSTDPGFTGAASASDNCTPVESLVITHTDDQSGVFGCNGTGILRRTWTATDACGNSSTCVQSIWIIDDADPVISCPANIEISCSDPKDPSFTGYATATDNCTPDVEITYSDNAQLTGCNASGLILRTWSARDACGNVKTCMQLITVTDKTPPVITCPRDTMIDCGFYNNPDVLGYPTGTDNCTASEDLILDYDDDLSGLTGCTNTGVILRTWYMQDACGNIGSCVQVITVADTMKPVINCPADVVITCQDNTLPAANGKATATDYCTASLFIDITYSDDLSQAGLCNGSGFIYRTWIATDDCNNSATCVQTIEIVDDVAPEITCPASYAISCEADRSPAVQGWAFASDNCTESNHISIAYEDDISNLTGCNQTGNLYRTWTATDACGNQSTCIQVMTIIDTKKPVVTPPPAITISCEQSLEEAVTGNIIASDNCTPLEKLNIQVNDDVTGINGCNSTGTIKRTWIVSDDCGNSATCSQNIRIIDATPPAISCEASIQISCGESMDPSVLGEPVISDNCTAIEDMDLLHFDNTTGLNGCNGTGTLFRTWVAFDDCGNSTSCVQAIQVVDHTPPQIVLPDNLTISCEYRDDNDELGYASAFDGCTPDALIEISYKDNDLGLALCNSTGLRERTWTAMDLCGNSSTAVQYIQFIDTLGPIYYTPFDIAIDCNDNPLDMDFMGEVDVYTDNCANPQDIQIEWHDDLLNIENCDGNPVIRRMWTLTDPCGNSSTSAQKITVMNYSMNAIQFPGDIDIPCDADMMDLAITGSVQMPSNNACSYLVDTMYSVELGEIEPYVFQRKWVCIDYCGHIEESVQTINLVDDVKPHMIVQDIAISFAQGAEVGIDIEDVLVEVYDNCDPHVTLALSQDTFDCDDFMSSPEQTITLTATDDQGNVTVEEITVTLVGGLFIMDCPQDIIVYLESGECAEEVHYSLAPEGLCGQDPVVTQIDASGLTSGDPFPIGTTRQMYAITDQLGYTLECAFNIQVLEFPDQLTLACQETLHVSVVFECEAVITPDMLLEGDHYGCYDDYVITFTDPNVVYEGGVLDGHPHIGNYLEACITEPETGNYCCSWLLIEDKLPPVLTCSDITIDCDESALPQAIPHFPVPDGTQVTPLGGNRYRVEGIDNCGSATISYTDTQETFMCGGDFTGIITRTWISEDESGMRDTCTEQIFLRRGEIDDFNLPGDTTIFCGNHCLRPDGTPDPNCIGGIEGPFCGQFFFGYTDKVIGYCGASYSVKRDWTLVDWCTGTIINHEQIINIEDNIAPVFECADTIFVGAEFGKCGAEMHLTPPVAVDACGSEPLFFELIYNGQTILETNGEFILPTLGLGAYEVLWRVTDACGNFSTCETIVVLFDDTPPVAYCDKHTVIAINNQDPMGVALLPATTLDDGSFDNCGPVTFRARRMSSCIDFDWTTNGHVHTPDGDVDNFDKGLTYNEYVPVSCCDAGEDYILVQLEVRDLHGNVNYCMVEVAVQDKLPPVITCPPDITVSCQFWFDVNGLTDLSNRTFGTVVDGFHFDQSFRQPVIINDPGNPEIVQPHLWGLDGFVEDNCNLDLEIRVTDQVDCTGEEFPANAPAGAVRLITRRFLASDPAGQFNFCTQRIWVVNFDPFYINPENTDDPNDDIVWPEDIFLDNCGIPDTIYPIILNNGCGQIGMNLKERRFEHTEGACVKILRDWTVIDWCQYNPQTGAGLWRYTQVVKITDDAGAVFTDCDPGIVVLCDSFPGVTQVVDPDFETSCFVHLDIFEQVESVCSDEVTYDVKIYLPNSNSYYQAVGPTDVFGVNGVFQLRLNTATSPNLTLRNYGLEYNDPDNPDEYYRILWSVVDGCGNVTTCEEKVRLEDCKQPTPVCINGLSTVPMPSTGNITLWAKDFDASSFDNCTADDQLRFSFSGTVYQPSMLFSCDDILALGVEIPVNIWVWDNYDNRDYCETTIVFTDPSGVCGLPTGGVSGLVMTHQQNISVANVGIHLIKEGEVFGSFTTGNNGSYQFPIVPGGYMYSLEADRNDNPRNGVTTLDLIMLQQHLLGQEPLNSPYQLIAADANSNGNVSAFDLVEIRRLILGKYLQFPDNKSWRFVPQSFQFQDPYNPWPFEESSSFMVDTTGVIENFVGIKIGDLNQSVEAHFNIITPRSERTAFLTSTDRYMYPGETAEVQFEISEVSNPISGAQWSLNLQGASLKNITPVTPELTEDMWLHNGTTLRVSWHPKQAVEASAVISLTIEATTAGWLSEMISLDHSFMKAELYSHEKETYNLGLLWRDPGTEEVTESIQLYQNQPNPWIQETVIPFDLPEAGEVTLTITNAIGEEMTKLDRHFSSGKQQIKITNESWPAGMYYYTIRFGDTQLTKTMLILNKR